MVTVPSGLLLLVCFFLPAVRGCSDPVYPYEVPVFSLPYLLGACAAAAALLAGGRAERILAVVVMVLSVLSTIWFALWTLNKDGLVGVYLSLAASAWLVVGTVWWRREMRCDAAPLTTLPVARLAHVHAPSPRSIALVVAMLLSMGVSFALAPPASSRETSREIDLRPVFWRGC